MMVGGGAVPATSLTRHEVHRPRPPQVAVMSTPEAWADFRIVVPGFVSRTWRPGRMVSGIAIPGAGYHFFLDFPRGFADSCLHSASGGVVAPVRRLSPPLVGSDAARDGARHLLGDARHAGQSPRPGRGGGNPPLAGGQEESRGGLGARKAALRPVRHLPAEGA